MAETRSHLQIVELLYVDEPSIDHETLRDRVAEMLGTEIDLGEREPGDTTCMLFHKQFVTELQDGKVCLATAIMQSECGEDPSDLQAVYDQSWRCKNPEALYPQCKHAVLVSEMMALGQEPQVRVNTLHAILQTLVEMTQPLLLRFVHTQQFVAGQDYLDASDQKPILRPGAINVRFYNISNSEGDMIVDTRGLDELNLPDVQCHFRDLDPSDIAGLAANVAVFIFEKGAVIESGDTIDGPTGTPWVCQHEESMLEPTREILDLNPGAPHAAGNRE